jgi:hypothetical protein
MQLEATNRSEKYGKNMANMANAANTLKQK